MGCPEETQMANIVTSIFTELLPSWMERKARREQPDRRHSGAAMSPQPEHSERTRQSKPASPRVHRPKSPPSHWRASSM